MKHESTNRTSSVVVYVHDANGNLMDDGVSQYQYDAANQLTNVIRTADGARVLSARYDALGRRVEAIRGDGSVERYVYFPGSFLVLTVLDGTNAVKEVYTRGPDLSGSLDGAGGIGGILACTYASGATYCSHADIMGNVIALTDASGSVAATFRYTPFGQLSARTGTLLPRYLFSSKEFDRTANLYYYGYRYYAPRLGRWMTRDPLGEVDTPNVFVFVRNVANNNIDAFGLVGEGIIAIGEIPGIAEKLDELYVRLAAKAIRISGGTVEKTNFTSWPLKAGPEIFFQQFIQAIYDELQARLENVVNDLGICASINKVFLEEKDDQGYPEMKGEITVKEYSFPAITKPWTWSTAPTIARSMFYEPCPDNCHWRVYYYVPLSTDLTTWNEIERFSCSGEPKCVKNACGSSR